MKNLFSKLMLVALMVTAFTACEDVPSPYDVPGTGSNVPGAVEIPGGEGEGTFAVPFNTIAALNFGSKLAIGETSKNYMYIKGVVSKLAPAEKDRFENNSYGNGTFYISTDGGHGNEFYVYRVNYLGNKKFASGDTPVAVGDNVIICAKITNYNGTIETNQGEGFVYELNGVNRGGEILPSDDPEGEPSGDGTLENPFNAVAAIKYAEEVGDAESPKNVYIKGKVAKITEQYSTNYGNATFSISDDGTTATTTFTIFRALYLGNKKYSSGDLLAEGDEVIVCGKVTNFKGNTPETVTGKAYLYSLNGVTGGDTPQPAEPKGTGTAADPFNPMAAINYTSALPADQESDKDIYIKGKVSQIKFNYVADQYGNATFYISEDGTTSNEFYCFRTLYLNNEKYTQGDLLKVGDEVVVCGKVINYKGNTPETVQNKSYLVSLTPGAGGGDDPTPGPGTQTNVTKEISGTTMTLTYNDATPSSNSITVNLGEQGWSNAQEVTELTLTDGTKITFAQGDGKNAPKYYDATKGMRLYAKNVMGIEGIKTIAKVVIECDNYQGANVGNDELYASVTGKTMTIINEWSTNSGGSQFRPKTVTITYAE